jgi:hypothetical protein
VLVGLLGWLVRSDLPLTEAGVRLFAAVLLVATPVQPWYALLLLALGILPGSWWTAVVAAAAYPLYVVTVLEGPAVLLGRVSYGLAAAVVLAVAASRSRRERGHRPVPGGNGRARAGSAETGPGALGRDAPAVEVAERLVHRHGESSPRSRWWWS